MSEVANEINTFSIKTEVFEGPLELLIELVEKHKLLINDISLTMVTNEYLEQVANMQKLSLPGTAEFIVLASTLLLIKSKSLLPLLELTQEEEESIDDLEVRLKLYQIYRNAGKIIEEVFGTNILHEKNFVQNNDPLFVTDKYTKISRLSSSVEDLINNLPKKIEQPKVKIRKIISLEEMIEKLYLRVQKHLKSTLRDLTDNNKERVTVIVGFLAILEMIKQGRINAMQEKRFEDIYIEREDLEVPKYN